MVKSTGQRQQVMPRVLKWYRDRPNVEYPISEVAAEVGVRAGSASGAAKVLVTRGMLVDRGNGYYMFSTNGRGTHPQPAVSTEPEAEEKKKPTREIFEFVGMAGHDIPSGARVVIDEKGVVWGIPAIGS